MSTNMSFGFLPSTIEIELLNTTSLYLLDSAWPYSILIPRAFESLPDLGPVDAGKVTISAWQNGSLALRACNTGNCSVDCLNPDSWFLDFNTCSFYSTFSSAIADKTLNETQILSLQSQGIYPDPKIAKSIEQTTQTCLHEYCSFSDKCSKSPAFNSCASTDGGIVNAYTCLSGAICNPTYANDDYNADIAGIGVIASYFMQTAIAIFSYLTLVLFQKRNKWLNLAISVEQQKRQFHILKNTIINFQKTQCYFACAIETAGLLYLGRGLNTSNWSDATMLFVVSTIGYTPIFTQTLIQRYGRSSWYLYILSTFSYILGTGLFYRVIKLFRFALHVKSDDESASAAFLATFPREVPSFPACGNTNGFTVYAENNLCALAFPAPGVFRTYFLVALTPWVITTLWLIYNFLEELETHKSTQPFIPWLQKRGSHQTRRHRSTWRNVFSHMVLILSWAIVFGIQLYFFVEVCTDGVDFTWGFGQVVGVTIWVPVAIEYIYYLIYHVEAGDHESDAGEQDSDDEPATQLEHKSLSKVTQQSHLIQSDNHTG